MEDVTDAPDKQGDNRAKRGARKGPPKETQWKPGQSGNPAGRPKTITLSEAYRRELAKVDPTDEQKRTFAEILAEQTVIKAKGGDVSALRELADRTEGKAKQTITLTTDRREQIEQAVERMIERAAADGQTLTRDEAVAALAAYVPEASALIH